MAASRDNKRDENSKNQNTGGQSSSHVVEAKETFATLLELSKLLNTGLDSETLSICVRLCERGAHPEALATVVRELRRESQAIRQVNSQ